MIIDTKIPLSKYLIHAYNCNPLEREESDEITIISTYGYGAGVLLTILDNVDTIKIPLEKYMLERDKVLGAVEKYESDHFNCDTIPVVHIQITDLEVE